MNVEAAIKQTAKQMGLSPFDINNGYCEEFARQVCRLVNGAEETSAPGEGFSPEEAAEWGIEPEELLFGHVWIEYKGRCYDAECPEGVEDVHDLPIFKRRTTEGE